MVLTVTIVQTPQRFMLVNGRYPIDAGVGLLPFATVMAFTSVVVSVIGSKTPVPVSPTLIFGALLQVGGAAGLSQSFVRPDIEASQHRFQVLSGVGVGLVNIIVLLMSPLIANKQLLCKSQLIRPPIPYVAYAPKQLYVTGPSISSECLVARLAWLLLRRRRPRS